MFWNYSFETGLQLWFLGYRKIGVLDVEEIILEFRVSWSSSHHGCVGSVGKQMEQI